MFKMVFPGKARSPWLPTEELNIESSDILLYLYFNVDVGWFAKYSNVEYASIEMLMCLSLPRKNIYIYNIWFHCLWFLSETSQVVENRPRGRQWVIDTMAVDDLGPLYITFESNHVCTKRTSALSHHQELNIFSSHRNRMLQQQRKQSVCIFNKVQHDRIVPTEFKWLGQGRN